MFRPEKDERLWRIELEAGMTAWISYFFLILGLMIVRGFVDWEVLSDPDFLLVVPWLLTGLVFFAVEWKKGYYAAVREENTRTRERLWNTRSSLLLSVVLLAIISFVIKRLQLFSDSPATLTEDLTDAGIFALIWGAAVWFLTARKSRRAED
jgi:hypothetical protein